MTSDGLVLTGRKGRTKAGPFTPYRQSERQDIYDHMISQLMADGKAYRCFCTEDELEKARLQQVANHEPPRYNGKCRNMGPSDIQKLRGTGKATYHQIQGRGRSCRGGRPGERDGHIRLRQDR